jgi:hypothetical protein
MSEVIIKPQDYPGIFTCTYLMYAQNAPIPAGYRIPEKDLEITGKLNSLLLGKTVAEIWQYLRDADAPVPAGFEEIDHILRYLLILTDGPMRHTPEVYEEEPRFELNKLTDISDTGWYKMVNDINTRIVDFLRGNFDFGEEEVKGMAQGFTEIITAPTVSRLEME